MSRAAQGRRGLASAIVLGAGLLALLAGEADAAVTDRPFQPPSRTAPPPPETAVSAGELGGALGKAFRGRGGAPGLPTPAPTQVLFQRGAGKARALASNMKLFTTATAVARFGPDERLETRSGRVTIIPTGSSARVLPGRGRRSDPEHRGPHQARRRARVRGRHAASRVSCSTTTSSSTSARTVPQRGISPRRVRAPSAALTPRGRGGRQRPPRSAALTSPPRGPGSRSEEGPAARRAPGERRREAVVAGLDSSDPRRPRPPHQFPSNNYSPRCCSRSSAALSAAPGPPAGEWRRAGFAARGRRVPGTRTAPG